MFRFTDQVDKYKLHNLLSPKIRNLLRFLLGNPDADKLTEAIGQMYQRFPAGVEKFLETADAAALGRLFSINRRLNMPDVFTAQVVDLLKSQDTRLLQDVLKLGAQAVDDLAVILSKGATTEQILKLRFTVPGMSIAELRKLLEIQDMTSILLIDLFAVKNMSITELKKLLSIGGMSPILLKNLLSKLSNSIPRLKAFLRKSNDPSLLLELLDAPGMTTGTLLQLLDKGNVVEIKSLLSKDGMDVQLLKNLLTRDRLAVVDLRNINLAHPRPKGHTIALPLNANGSIDFDAWEARLRNKGIRGLPDDELSKKIAEARNGNLDTQAELIAAERYADSGYEVEIVRPQAETPQGETPLINESRSPDLRIRRPGEAQTERTDIKRRESGQPITRSNLNSRIDGANTQIKASQEGRGGIIIDGSAASSSGMNQVEIERFLIGKIRGNSSASTSRLRNVDYLELAEKVFCEFWAG